MADIDREFLEENREVWKYRNLCEAAPDMLAALEAAEKQNQRLIELLGEIERLRADKDVRRSQERNTGYEKDIQQLETEIERLRDRNALLEAAHLAREGEIERLHMRLNMTEEELGAWQDEAASVKNAREHERDD